MTEALLLIGCVDRPVYPDGLLFDRLAVPSLLIFIALGMCFGETDCCASILTTTIPSI